ncbi:QWRF motif-containing protein [Actinidia chinensis var. chinensis]|uniref:QWRF motif-containing protein n=1 Tax=Actinidia chinensis var. chinensis TaxID=1590841 RepID=A0A2R6R382_ACTCC|nr:QWRF motif-containing protein [Actinidia chinensis var. chinensis]
MVTAVVQQNPRRPPLLPSETDYGVVGHRKPKSREVTSRYLSSSSSNSTTSSSATSSSYSSSSNSSFSRRSHSPAPEVKRSQSVDGRRPATPRPSTPDTSAAAKLLLSSKRSLSVSFQGDSFALPISKEKPSPAASGLSSARRGTPERRRATPMKDQMENSKPIEQQRWPGRSREANFMTRSMDCTADKKKSAGSGSVVRALQKSTIDESNKASFDDRLKVKLPNTELVDANSDPIASESESVSSASSGAVKECGTVAQVRGGPRGIVVPARFWQETTNRVRRLAEPVSPVSKNNVLKTVKKSFIDGPVLSPRGVPNSRCLSSSLHGGVRPSSPSKLVMSLNSSPSRGMPSPTRVRNGVASTFGSDLGSTPSILSFANDVRRGKVGEIRVADAHLLRLLYNRHLQWRFINARADAAMSGQKVTAEKSLYNAWVATSKLWHSVKRKRVELQLLQQNLKMYSIIRGQMPYLDDWDLIDRDHSSSLPGIIEALEASTLRLPVGGGARADIQNVKDAICSAVDVMQAMASSICSLLTKVDQVNLVMSELAKVTSTERALLGQCNDLLSTLTAMQVLWIAVLLRSSYASIEGRKFGFAIWK